MVRNYVIFDRTDLNIGNITELFVGRRYEDPNSEPNRLWCYVNVHGSGGIGKDFHFIVIDGDERTENKISNEALNLMGISLDKAMEVRRAMQYLTKMVLTLSLFFGIHFVYANEIYDKNERGVVLIMGDNGFGSGVILSQKGYVLTNSHVISDNPNLKVLLNYNYPLDNIEDYSHDVIILKQDQSKDLALLKIKNPKTLLHTVKLVKKYQTLVIKFMP